MNILVVDDEGADDTIARGKKRRFLSSAVSGSL
jgi:hypothetical protein